jgi:shikimate dehydrogenase
MRSFQTQLVALFGQPVAENPTQAMIEAAFRHHGLDWRYLTIEVSPNALGAAVGGARAMGFRGFHCTLPHKIAVIEHLDRLGTSAELIGAVNTVVSDAGDLVGENTDGRGFVEAVRKRLTPQGASAVILGAGGAARAIAMELALAGAHAITIVNRREGRGRELVSLLNNVSARLVDGLHARFLPWSGEIPVPDADLIVNATSIGLFPDVAARVPIAADSLNREVLVADVIPNPPRTRFLAEAQQRGCEVIDGLEMLVEQGALSIRYWAGIEPERSVMRDALTAIFDGPNPA